MFAIGIRYLNGWAMAAADGARKEVAEWPPHPDRVFMALAGAWFETGKDENEGNALRWLEQISPPRLVVSEARSRLIPTTFVPVNDNSKPLTFKGSKKKGTYKEVAFQHLSTSPIGRARQPRSFPVIVPHVKEIGDIPEIYLTWRKELPEELCQSLKNLCEKVVYIGHSASLVQMWVTQESHEPNLVPTEGITTHRLRVFGPGRLNYLEEKCNQQRHIDYADQLFQEELIALEETEKKKIRKKRENYLTGIVDRLRPEPGLWRGYNEPTEIPSELTRGSVFDPRLVVFSLFGKRLGLHFTLKITEALRGALLAACPEPIPEWVSGHTPDGKRSEKPHVALIPLPFVGREYADGGLMGMAFAIPRLVESLDAEKIFVPWLRDEYGLPRRICLFDGKWFECSFELETRDETPFNLKPETWSSPSKCWATVTPVVLDRHFKGGDKWDKAAESVKDSCERIGLPRPLEVMLQPVSLFEGVPRSNEFPWMSRKSDGGRMHHSHAVVVFQEKVQGPVILGAGRYRGYGLCRPVNQGGGQNG